MNKCYYYYFDHALSIQGAETIRYVNSNSNMNNNMKEESNSNMNNNTGEESNSNMNNNTGEESVVKVESELVALTAASALRVCSWPNPPLTSSVLRPTCARSASISASTAARSAVSSASLVG